MDFSKDTVLNMEEEDDGLYSTPAFVASKWTFFGDTPTSGMPSKQRVPSDVQLIHHCQCFLKQTGVPLPVVITSLQFSRSNKL